MNLDPIISTDERTARWTTLQAVKSLFGELERVKSQLATITQQNNVMITAAGTILAEDGPTLPIPVPQEFRLFRLTREATGQSDQIYYTAQQTPGVWLWKFLIEP